MGALTVNSGTMKIGKAVNSTNDGIYINTNNYWYSTGLFSVGNSTNNVIWDGTSLAIKGKLETNGTPSGYANNTLTIDAGKISADQVIYLNTLGWVDITGLTGVSITGDTEITGAIQFSGNTLFQGAYNQIGDNTEVGGISTKNIRNIWIRSTLVSLTSSDGFIGDVWLQYA